MMTETVKASAQNSVPLNPMGAAAATGEAVPRGIEFERGQEKPDLQEIEAVTSSLKQSFEMIHQLDLQFSVHKASGRTVVTVKDALTGEVIREIPPSELLNLAARLDEMVGLLFDQVG